MPNEKNKEHLNFFPGTFFIMPQPQAPTTDKDSVVTKQTKPQNVLKDKLQSLGKKPAPQGALPGYLQNPDAPVPYGFNNRQDYRQWLNKQNPFTEDQAARDAKRVALESVDAQLQGRQPHTYLPDVSMESQTKLDIADARRKAFLDDVKFSKQYPFAARLGGPKFWGTQRMTPAEYQNMYAAAGTQAQRDYNEAADKVSFWDQPGEVLFGNRHPYSFVYQQQGQPSPKDPLDRGIRNAYLDRLREQSNIDADYNANRANYLMGRFAASIPSKFGWRDAVMSHYGVTPETLEQEIRAYDPEAADQFRKEYIARSMATDIGTELGIWGGAVPGVLAKAAPLLGKAKMVQNLMKMPGVQKMVPWVKAGVNTAVYAPAALETANEIVPTAVKAHSAGAYTEDPDSEAAFIAQQELMRDPYVQYYYENPQDRDNLFSAAYSANMQPDAKPEDTLLKTVRQFGDIPQQIYQTGEWQALSPQQKLGALRIMATSRYARNTPTWEENKWGSLKGLTKGFFNKSGALDELIETDKDFAASFDNFINNADPALVMQMASGEGQALPQYSVARQRAKQLISSRLTNDGQFFADMYMAQRGSQTSSNDAQYFCDEFLKKTPEQQTQFFRQMGKDAYFKLAREFATPGGQEALKKLPQETQKQMTDAVGGAMKASLWERVKEDWSLLPDAFALWMRTMGMEGVGQFIEENNWAFYGGAAVLLLGTASQVGSIFGDDDDDDAEEDEDGNYRASNSSKARLQERGLWNIDTLNA